MADLLVLEDGEEVCVGQTRQLGNNSIANAVQIQWNIIGSPAACQPLIDDPTVAITDVTFACLGTHVLQRCLYFQTDNQAPPDTIPTGNDLTINCPISMLEFESATISLTGCDNGTTSWTVSGPVTFAPTGSTGGVLLATGTGAGSLAVICTRFDVDGNEITTQADCDFEIFPADEEYVFFEAEPYVANVELCGTSCVCQEVTVVVTDCEDECITLQYGLTFRACEDCPPKDDEQSPLQLAMVGGASQIPYNCNDDDIIVCGCDEEEYCCEEHAPTILWNNAFSCGWEFTATNTIEGSSIVNANPCNVGQEFCFQGSTVITGTGPPLRVDTFFLWGHNLGSGSVTTSPLSQFENDDTRGFGLVGDSSCADAEQIPFVMYFSDIPDNITSFTATITPDDPNKIYCIDSLFLGEKFFLPEDSIPQPWTNPFRGTDREIDVRKSDCGLPISMESRRTEQTIEIPIRCMSEKWAYEDLRPLLRYLSCGNPLIYSWSRNNFEHEIFYGRIQPNAGTQYSGKYQNITLTAKGWINQPQEKDYV